MSMTPCIERHVEMIRLQGTTPDEIAQEYASIINKRWKEPSIQFSSSNNDMLRYAPAGYSIRTIDGVYFIELEYAFWLNEGKEEDD